MKTRLFLFTGQALDVASFCLFFMIVPATILAQLDVAEQNPIIATAFAIGGFLAVAAIKFGAVGIVLYRDSVRPHRPKLTQAIMLPVAASGYVGAFFNTLALVTILGVLNET